MTRNEAREIMMQILYELDATKALEAEKAVSLAKERLPGDHAVRGGKLLSDITGSIRITAPTIIVIKKLAGII